MSPDDKDGPGPPSNDGSGLSALADPEAEMVRDAANGAQELKAVRLICLFCREVRLIHVPAECDTPKEVLWECLACQERWAARK